MTKRTQLPIVLRVTKTAGGPAFSVRADHEYLIPGDLSRKIADSLVVGGAAEWVEGATEPKRRSSGERWSGTSATGPRVGVMSE